MKNVRDAGFSRKRGGNEGSGPPLPDPLCYVSKQDFPVVLLICFPINDNFARTHTKNIPSCCDINNFASTLESKE